MKPDSSHEPSRIARVKDPRIVAVVGGGAAGFLAAITCAESAPGIEVVVLEKSPHFLSKVRISGGGRCNVTHACFDPRTLAEHFPRGRRELIGPFTRFQARDTIAWFESRGVPLKAEADGRVFPQSDSSETIISCLVAAAKTAGVRLRTHCGVDRVIRRPEGGFELLLPNGQTLGCDRLLLATGGCRTHAAGILAVSLGHTLEPPVPSLFTFHVADLRLSELAGISVESAALSIQDTDLAAQGPLLITHSGLSGPAVLRLSSWGARDLHDRDYRFSLRVNWLPQLSREALAMEFDSRRTTQRRRSVATTQVPPLPDRLWRRLVRAADIDPETRWSDLSRQARNNLIGQLTSMQLSVTGKSMNKEEFVTCGGIRSSEIDFKTMQSRVCAGLYCGGELLDIDGITGGFNLQSAWTTGWIAGHSMAGASHRLAEGGGERESRPSGKVTKRKGS